MDRPGRETHSTSGEGRISPEETACERSRSQRAACPLGFRVMALGRWMIYAASFLGSASIRSQPVADGLRRITAECRGERERSHHRAASAGELEYERQSDQN